MGIDILSIPVNITLEWMPEDFIDGEVNIGSGNGLVPSGNNPLPEPVLTRCQIPLGISRPQLIKRPQWAKY